MVITCRIRRVRCTRFLDVSQNNLNSTLSPQLGALTALRWLNVDGNMLTGTLPSTLCNLVNLQYFDVGIQGRASATGSDTQSSLAGTLPAEFSTMTALK